MDIHVPAGFTLKSEDFPLTDSASFESYNTFCSSLAFTVQVVELMNVCLPGVHDLCVAPTQ